MRIVIFGAGSLGSALGALLSRSNKVALIGRHAHMSAVRRHGLRVVGDINLRVKLEAYESVDEAEPPELVVLTTKAYDTSSAVDSCRAWASGDVKVLTLQNGLGNLDALREWKGRQAFGGTTTMGANLLCPGKVRLSGFGRTVIGSDEDPIGAQSMALAFAESGLPSVTKDEIVSEIWAKAIVSASINPLTAILRIPNGKLLESASISRLMSEICEECELVARGEGIRLPYASMKSRARAVAKDTSNNRSSMLQDIERGRRTEVAQINGAFVRHGLEQSVMTPLNLTLLAMIESLEASRNSA
jgi:2-dehydropantoate 2-reductase